MKQGTLKLIPITKVNEEMQVYFAVGNSFHHQILTIKPNGLGIGKYADNEECIAWAKKNILGLKTIVMEYEENEQVWPKSGRDAAGNEKYENLTKQISLKDSQWQQVLDNNLIDTEVEFDIWVKTQLKEMTSFHYAKIIFKEKKVYTEEDIQKMINKALDESFEGWSDEAIKGYKTAMKSIIHRLKLEQI